MARFDVLLQQPGCRPLRFRVRDMRQDRRNEILLGAMAFVGGLQCRGGLAVPASNRFGQRARHLLRLRCRAVPSITEDRSRLGDCHSQPCGTGVFPDRSRSSPQPPGYFCSGALSYLCNKYLNFDKGFDYRPENIKDTDDIK